MKRQLIHTIALLIGLLVSIATQASLDEYNSRIEGTEISVGQTGGVHDGKIAEIQSGASTSLFWDNKVTNKLILGLDESLLTTKPLSFTRKVGILITPYSVNGTPLTGDVISQELIINYDDFEDGLDRSKDVFVFDGYHSFKYEITYIRDESDVDQPSKENIYIESEIAVERYYFLNTSDVPFNSAGLTHAFVDTDGDQNTPADEVDIRWGFYAGAEEYELEWTYVNNYEKTYLTNGATFTAGEIEFSDRAFDLNNTRIKTTAHHYQIPLVYDQGFLIYRIRAIGRLQNDPNTPIFGRWSSYEVSGNTHVSSYAPHYIALTNEHAANKNWQYTGTYAEEGKRKDVISYFDGTLRNRQSVTRINSDNQTIVGESIYDNQGRAAIQTLPTPTGSPTLMYYTNYNQDASNARPYDERDFDRDVNCISSTASMGIGSGSSKYYSPAVSEGTHQDYVPDAFGYPFSQIEYEPDNTGRIRRQSGVGINHQLVSDILPNSHQTQYFYGQPYQEELDRLFGYEVGYKSRYKKNLVVDANGQVSVTYLDPQGRTIATALIGDNPDNLDPVADINGVDLDLDGGGASQVLTVDLLNKIYPEDLDSDTDDNERFSTGLNGPLEDGLRMSSEVHVPFLNQPHQLDYQIEMVPFTDNCMDYGGVTKYFPVVYDLGIQMEDKCDVNYVEVQYNGASSNPLFQPTAGYVPTTDPTTGLNVGNPFSVPQAQLLATGMPVETYSLSKNLTVNQAALAAYTEEYILLGQSNECISELEDFEQVEALTMNPADCFVGCKNCLEQTLVAIGAEAQGWTYPTEEYSKPYEWETLYTTYGIAGSTGISMIDWMDMYNSCTDMCQETTSLCESVYNAMLADVSPGGQYGEIDAGNTEATDPLSIFNESSQLDLGTDITWRTPVSNYLEADGSISYVLNSAGDLVLPNDATISLEEFLQNWKSSWAKTLILAHPEYCYYDDCIEQELLQGSENYSSEDFDNALRNSTYASGAVNVSIVSEQGTYSEDLLDLTNFVWPTASLVDLDPYFATGNPHMSVNITTGPTGAEVTRSRLVYARELLSEQINNYQNSGFSMADFASIVVTGGTWYSPGGGTGFSGLGDPYKAQAWENFKYYYLSEKQKITQMLADVYAVENGCYNGCIGSEETFSIGANDFGEINLIVDDLNPCYLGTFGLYQDKQRRWASGDYGLVTDNPVNNTDFLSAQNDADYALYRETGKCPIVLDLERLFSSIVINNEFTQSFDLNGYTEYRPEFTYDLYIAVTGSNPTPQNIYNWSPQILATDHNVLNITLNTNGVAPTCNTFDFTLENHIKFAEDWDSYYNGSTGTWQIVSIEQFIAKDAGTYRFIANVDTDLTDPDNELVEVAIEGTTCIDMACSISDFDPDCEPNELAREIILLMNTLDAMGNFNSTFVDLDVSPYNQLGLDKIMEKVNASSISDIKWGYNGTIAVVNNINNNLKIKVFDALPANLSSIEEFSNINTNGITSDIVLSYYDNTNAYKVVTLQTNMELHIDDVYDSPLTLDNCCSAGVPSEELVYNGDFEAVHLDFKNICNSNPAAVCNPFDDPYGVGEGECAPYTNSTIANGVLGFQSYFNYLFNASASCLKNIRLLKSLNKGSETDQNMSHASDAWGESFDHTFGTSEGTFIILDGAQTTSEIATDPGDLFWYQNIEVEPNSTYEFSFYVKVLHGTVGDNSIPKFDLLIDRGNGFGSILHSGEGKYLDEILITTPLIQMRDEDWHLWKEVKGVITTLSGEASITLGLASKVGEFDGNDFAIDDISLKKISCNECEPQLLSPLSCNAEYKFYADYMFAVNTPYTTSDFNYSEETFCEGEYQYCWHNYKSYISTNAIYDAGSPHYVRLEEYCAGKYDLFTTQYLNYYNSVGSLYSGFELSLQDFANGGYSEACVAEYITYFTSLGAANAEPLYDFCFATPVDVNKCQPIMAGVEYLEGTEPCSEYINNLISQNAEVAYEEYLDNIRKDFQQRYIEHAISNVKEQFYDNFTDQEYHYTLFYYDQSGSLARTVPPNGVDKLDYSGTSNDAIKLAIKETRRDKVFNVTTEALLPVHSYFTTYNYNTLNQLVEQTTPDGGTSKLYYDYLSRIVASQNADQVVNNEYSYTRYDGLGRIVEAGQLEFSTGNDISSVTELELNSDLFPYNITGMLAEINEVSRTYYDQVGTVSPLPSGLFTNDKQTHLRNRISRVTYQEVVGDPINSPFNQDEYERATHYSYDVHGNVKELVQENRSTPLAGLNNEFKRMEYTYDLISGNVLEVAYQSGELDRFYHRYCYDADNRITQVLTSEDYVNWRRDAKYFYYEHGPLARTELGHDKVQGSDYAYTIQGWLKSVNGNVISESKEIGKDGNYSDATNLHRNTGKDAFGFGLRYFTNDYSSRTTLGVNNFIDPLAEAVAPTDRDLFNGNISQMAVALSDLSQARKSLMANNYTYDQLNRLKSMHPQEFGTIDYSGAPSSVDYNVDVLYDPNGNILNLKRNSNLPHFQMDDFNYSYIPGTNKLDHVDDNPLYSGRISDDIDDQALGNYAYYNNGELRRDVQEEIDQIDWYVTGKVKNITRVSGSDKDDLSFEYDGMGNRVTKIVKPRFSGNPSSEELWEYTYYVRDAQGNPLSTYKLLQNGAVDNLILEEKHIYGSSRVGVVDKSKLIKSTIFTPSTEATFAFNSGERNYELSNHLGNVMSVVTDKKIIQEYAGDIYFDANVINYNDYYPFGMLMPGRHESTESYRYGFQGQEMDNEVKGVGNSLNYTHRMHDPRLGRFFAIDPLTKSYPHYTPYSFSGNKVIAHRELEGLEEISVHVSFDDEGQAKFKMLKYGNSNFVFDYVSFYIEELDAHYTFTRVPNAQNFWDDAADFYEDPMGAIMSGQYATDEEILDPTEIAKDIIIGMVIRRSLKGIKTSTSGGSHQPAWLKRVRQGVKFQQSKLAELKKAGADHIGQATLVPKNGKGNIKGNRTNTDAVIRESDGNGGFTYTIKEYKLSSKTKLSGGQQKSKKHVESGSGEFEVRSDIPKWNLKKGDVIKVNQYQVESKE